MSAPTTTVSDHEQAGESSIWVSLPWILAAIGLIGCVIGYTSNPKQLGYSYLTAFMFFLSIGLGSLFLVLIHHIFDAGWGVPIRRYLENVACLLPYMGLLFIPLGFWAENLYPWMTADPHTDHALSVKSAMFNKKSFFIVSAIVFAIWGVLSHKLRYWSVRQDETGGSDCTHAMRRWAAPGIYLFAFSLTAGAIFWMKSLQHQWFSTMYGVYYFAGSVWITLATTYGAALILKKTNQVPMLQRLQFYHLGTLLLAFTIFYSYIHFSQYFIIWNAAMPEETFWYVLREKGTWVYVCWALILGHFVVPFLTLLRIDVKLKWAVMVPVICWVWMIHYVDMQFNIMPLYHPNGISPSLSDLSAMLFIGGTLAVIFLRNFRAHSPFPLKDPRMGEAIKH